MISISEHYSNITRLAQSGMGEVYVATDTRLDRKVAIKFIKSHLGSNADVMREAKLLARLNHHNIVQLYDVKDSAQGLYLEMEYVAGQTLTHYTRTVTLSLEKKLSLLSDIANGLVAAHERNILHLDLKPENILVNEQGVAKIADFGIAQLKEQGAKTANTSFGSLKAMSPEQMNRLPLDHRSDLFSFGIIAFQLLAGRHPFGEDSDKAVAERIRTTQLPETANLVFGLPKPLTDLMDALLKQDPQKRPLNTQIVAHQLKQALLQASYEDSNDTMALNDVLPPPRYPHLKRVLFASLGVVFITLLCVFGYQYWQANKPKIYVAALPPEFSGDNQLADSHKQILNLAIDDAIKQHFLNSKRYVLISDSEVNQAKRLLGDNASLKELGHALNAEELITVDANCTSQSCDFEFNIVDGQSATLISHLRNVSASKNYGELFNMASYSIRSLNAPNTETESVNKEVLEQYFSLHQKALQADANSDELMLELDTLIQNAPDFWPLYSIYTKVSIAAYRNSSNKKHLYSLKKTLDKSPEEFKKTFLFQASLLQLFQYLNDSANATKTLELIEGSAFDEFQKQGIVSVYYSFQKDYSLALKHAELAYKLRPTLDITTNLALFNIRLGKYKDALPYLKKALTYAPNDFKTLKAIADISLLLGNLAEANTSYEKLLNNRQVNTSTLNNYSVVLMLLGKLEQALIHSERVVALAPNNTEALINLADIHNLLGHSAKSLELYSKILAADEQQTLKLIRAQALAHLGRYQEALALIEKNILEEPESAEAYYVKTLIQTLIGENYSAIASLQQSLDLGWNSAFFRLGWFKPLCKIQKTNTLIGKENFTYLCN
ncbi:protein kinase [Pseudoalteromonas xiamenensis]|uniref:serine/threonine-protein kinase n=1 Tax=Pseudoalteromonas xiamenensis TaxID=882626 RepID=UPI0027E52035|nr:protein kinase [Pseudoalteromonas xiamenensis]WMN58897.1 protein kinase [Pseudoalteromonas xiamenensis]